MSIGNIYARQLAKEESRFEETDADKAQAEATKQRIAEIIRKQANCHCEECDADCNMEECDTPATTYCQACLIPLCQPHAVEKPAESGELFCEDCARPDCPRCDGAKQVPWQFDAAYTVCCPVCKGSGKFDG